MTGRLLIAVEVGSTYTKLAAFTAGADGLRLERRLDTRTTVDRGDVRYGVDRLLSRAELGPWDEARLTSSAAGGLRIAVSGLTPTLSTKVGREAALGAGGVVVFSSAGRLTAGSVRELVAARPGLVLVCGGTDDGERSAVLDNVAAVAAAPIGATVVYAGNAAARDQAVGLLTTAGKRCTATTNVYPETDRFEFDPVRDALRLAFERDVVKAPGVDRLAAELGGGCVPTPLAVSRAVGTLGRRFGGLLAFDVGGATTDVHSYVPGTGADTVVRATVEPALKRTVEGDLGVFHNLGNLAADGERLERPARPIADGGRLRPYALRAAQWGLSRHCGRAVRVTGPGGVREVVHGADLRDVPAVLATGGALRRCLADGGELRAAVDPLTTTRLVPREVRHWLVDRRYVLSALGALLPGHEPDVVRFVEAGLEEGSWR